MFAPEYSITLKTLNSISKAEYAKAVIENTTILPSWENQLKKEAKVKLISTYLKTLGLNTETLQIKNYLDHIENDVPGETKQLVETIDLVEKLSLKKQFTEDEIKEISYTLTNKKGYRDIKIFGKPTPEVLLAKIVQFFDWVHSLEGKETHPIISTAIVTHFFENLSPFKTQNHIITGLISRLFLHANGYSYKYLICFEEYLDKSSGMFKNGNVLSSSDPSDLTTWVEYFSEAVCIETNNVAEKIRLLARDTKIAKATGRTKFSQRQERIVEYLQDFGILQNKDFARVFPDISEDSILRDLKVLINKGVVQKNGSTKSSLYELA